MVFQPDSLPDDLESRELSDEERSRLSYYGPDQPPLFIGHYWCEGIPALPAPNIACLDYSAVKFGRLVATAGVARRASMPIISCGSTFPRKSGPG